MTPDPADTGPRPAASARWRPDTLHVTLASLALLLMWDLSGLDLVMLHWVGDVHGFALRDHVLTRVVLHEGGRLLGWAVAALLLVNVFRPWWPGLTRAERVRWLGVTLLCLAATSALKQLSHTSCPWDLAEFGGVARYVSHWRLGGDGGPGRCFPSGHASAAFAFFGGWFVLRGRHPRAARLWLAGVLLAGFLFGLGQFLRGAHPPSHSLWTAWVCWTLSATLLAPRRPGAPARAQLAGNWGSFPP